MKAMTSISFLALALSISAHAKGGGADRPEVISCALYFAGQPTPLAESTAQVQNASALLRGSAESVEYVFSVRGKTAVAKLTALDSLQTTTAQGAIEMLRHGGRTNAPVANAFIPLKRGGDDAQDGTPEKEAGFEINLARPNGSISENVKLKCLSFNTNKGVNP